MKFAPNLHHGLLLATAMSLFCLTSACSFRSADAEDASPKPVSYALQPDYGTGIGEALVEGVKKHPRQSAFRLVTNGSDAFFARVALIRLAERSLDFQYYIVENDVSGSLLLEEILRAADRNVRIRMLIDSIGSGKVGDEVALLAAHPNISIRVFNPASMKHETFLTSLAAWTVDFKRVNSRMHNKALISDNLAATIGGRNLGDQYFDVSADFTFSDMDVVAAGPIVRQISNSFDLYWNSEQAKRLHYAREVETDEEQLRAARADLHQRWEKAVNSEAGQEVEAAIATWMDKGKFAYPFTWAYADLVVDAPGKVTNNDDDPPLITQLTLPLPEALTTEDSAAEPDIETDKETSEPLTRLDELLEHAEESFTIISAYVVPRDSGVEWLGELEERGIDVRILTNSLDSTDVAAVHSGYSRYRPEMLRRGVDLYELKSIPQKRSRQNLFGSSPRSSLHAKTYIVDGKHLVVASFNLDPRSIEDNTELALTIHSRELAQEALKMFEETTAPDKSYRLKLASPDGDAIEWHGEANGQSIIHRHDPDASLWRRAKVFVYKFLPIEDLL